MQQVFLTISCKHAAGSEFVNWYASEKKI